MNKKVFIKNDRFATVVLALILLSGVFFRTIYISHNPMGHFGTPYFTIALDIVEGKAYPLEGPQLGFLPANHGPAAYYLLTLPILFNRSPVNFFVFIALLNVISIYVAYRIGKDFFSRSAGLTAALLHAVNPTLLIFTKDVSDKGLSMIFVTLVYYCFFAIVSKRNARFYWLVFPALFALGIQVHVQLGLILILCALQFLVYKPNIPKAHLIAGVAIGTLCLAPTIILDITQHKSHIASFIHAVADFQASNAKMPHDLVNRSGNIFSDYLAVFGVLSYFYLAAVAYLVFMLIRKKKTAIDWMYNNARMTISLVLFSVVSFLIFSKHPNQSLLRHFTSYTPMAILIGAAFNGLFSSTLLSKTTFSKILFSAARGAVALCFSAMILLYAIKSYGFAVIFVRPPQQAFFDRCERYMYLDNCVKFKENYVRYLIEHFSPTTYNYKRKQFDLFYNDFGISRETLLANAHGMKYLRMFGDGGYIFRTLRPEKTSPAANTFQYFVGDENSLSPYLNRVKYNKAVRLSDASIALQYRSYIDYSSIEYLSSFVNTDAPGRGEPRWSRLKLGANWTIDSFSNGQLLQWGEKWKENTNIVRGRMGKPGDFSSLLLVLEIMFPDQTDNLTGPDREVDIELNFNNKRQKTTKKEYEENVLYGESYKYYFVFDKKLFNDANEFMFKVYAPGPEKVYAIDAYDFVLKDNK